MYEVGIDLRIKGGKIVFTYCTKQYEIGSHPHESCTYICQNGEILHILHNAFETSDIEKMITRDKSFKACNSHYIGLDMMKEVLAATIDSGCPEMDFDFAEGLAIKRRNKREAVSEELDKLHTEEMREKMKQKNEAKAKTKTKEPPSIIKKLDRMIKEGFTPSREKAKPSKSTERKNTSDFISDGVLAYGVMVGRYVFKKEQKVVYAISDFPHIGPSDVFMTYQLSKKDYYTLLLQALPHQIPEPPVPNSLTESLRGEFLCGDSAYCKRNKFSLDDTNPALVESLNDCCANGL